MFGMIFLTSFILAVGEYDVTTTPRFYAKQGQGIQVYDTCTFDGFTCDVSYNCTFTILEPDQSIIVNQGATDHVGDLYLYNLTGAQTYKIGLYEVASYCINGTNAGAAIFYYQVNPTGNQFDNLWMNFVIIFFLSAGSIVVALSVGRADKFKDNQLFYYLAAFLLFCIGVYVIITGFGGYDNLMTKAFGYIVWGLGLYFLTKPWFAGGKWNF